MADTVREKLEGWPEKLVSLVEEGEHENIEGILLAVANDITSALAQLDVLNRRTIDVLEDEMYAHVNPESPFYNDCNGDDLCAWCADAQAIVDLLKEPK